MQGRSSAYRVLGIDPGLKITGYAVVDFGSPDPAIVEAGTIKTDPRGDLSARIEQIHTDLVEILRELRPDLAAVEKLYAHYKHPRTSILMAHARGAVLLACRGAGVSLRDLASTRIKKALTGNGHASKIQMQRAIKGICGLDQLPSPPDVADALAIALCAGHHTAKASRSKAT